MKDRILFHLVLTTTIYSKWLSKSETTHRGQHECNIIRSFY